MKTSITSIPQLYISAQNHHPFFPLIFSPLTSTIRLQSSSQHPDERGFSRSILSQHHNDLRVRELTGFDVKLEVTELFTHIRVVIATHSLNLLLCGCLGDFENQGCLTETEILSGNKTVQEDIDTCKDKGVEYNRMQRKWASNPLAYTEMNMGSNRILPKLPVQNTDQYKSL